MANEGQFPKVDGDVLYASEINSSNNSYSDMKTYNLVVTTTSANLDLSGISNKYAIEIRNVGNADCYFNLDSTATTSDMFIEAGAKIVFNNVNFNNLSAITASGSTTLSIAVYIGLNSKIGYKTNSEILNISATSTSSNASFTNTTDYKDILIINIGSYNAYININDTATTSDFILKPKETLSLMTNKYQFSAICDSGTTTIRILGVY